MFLCSSMFTIRDMKHSIEYPHFPSFLTPNFYGSEKFRYLKRSWIRPHITLFGVYMFLKMGNIINFYFCQSPVPSPDFSLGTRSWLCFIPVTTTTRFKEQQEQEEPPPKMEFDTKDQVLFTSIVEVKGNDSKDTHTSREKAKR